MTSENKLLNIIGKRDNMLKNKNAKFQVAVVAHKDISNEIKDITNKNSICNIKDIENLNELLKDHTYYNPGGSRFDMNDRMNIYLGWYKDEIEEKLNEDYHIDILELHRSYGSEDLKNLLDIEKEMNSKLLVLDTELL